MIFLVPTIHKIQNYIGGHAGRRNIMQLKQTRETLLALEEKIKFDVRQAGI